MSNQDDDLPVIDFDQKLTDFDQRLAEVDQRLLKVDETFAEFSDNLQQTALTLTDRVQEVENKIVPEARILELIARELAKLEVILRKK